MVYQSRLLNFILWVFKEFSWILTHVAFIFMYVIHMATSLVNLLFDFVRSMI